MVDFTQIRSSSSLSLYITNMSDASPMRVRKRKYTNTPYQTIPNALMRNKKPYTSNTTIMSFISFH